MGKEDVVKILLEQRDVSPDIAAGFRIVGLVKSSREDRLVSQEGRRGLDLTEIFGPVKSSPVKD